MRLAPAVSLLPLALLCAAALAAPAPAAVVRSEAQLRAAWADPEQARIVLGRDLVLRDCAAGEPLREAARPLLLDGRGHTLRQGCFEQRVLRQDGTGFVELRRVALTRGGSDGPGAGIASRGELRIVDARIAQNLAEEPGGGVFSQRGVTVVRSVLTGNLANDDGGAVYARRGGVRVVDSVLSGNVVDGSGGAIASTGDVVVVRSHVDGNTTDGDGGGIYADESGDVTVVDSSVDGNTADGPGGGIFTLDGDVTVIGSTVNGNRADDRGGAIAGEADVTVVDSTIARNAAVAHVGGGVWARGDLHVAGSTIAGNYAEGQGGGLLAAGTVTLSFATVVDNVAPAGANAGAGGLLRTFASVIGPARTGPVGEAQPTARNCQASSMRSYGFNVVSDHSCGVRRRGDVIAEPRLDPLVAPDGALRETRLPERGSPAVDRVPVPRCTAPPFGDPLARARARGYLAGTAAASWPAVRPWDERGVARPQGGGCDAGAAELTPTDQLVEDAARAAAGRGALARRVAASEATARRLDRWMACIVPVRVREYGDGVAGYLYDELDGNGEAPRAALALDRGRGGAGDSYDLLRFAPVRACASAPVELGRAAAGDERRLRARVARLRAAADRFDRWESCVRTLPVTQLGDGVGSFGFRLRGRRGHAAALVVDRSPVSDPDYRLLVRAPDVAAAGCDDDADAEVRAAEPLADALDEVEEQLGEFDTFDRCLYTLGARERGGYVFARVGRAGPAAPALALDLATDRLPRLQLLAFPSEEPPRVECDEDAGGEETDE